MPRRCSAPRPKAAKGATGPGRTRRRRSPTACAAQLRECPPELAARLALVHVAEAEDDRKLAPGEWLVTRAGRLRRWDGFVANGEGAAEAARLEAENRFAELDAALPARRAAAAEAESAQQQAQASLAALQVELVAGERAVAAASEAERTALRELDRAEDAKARHHARRAELDGAAAELAERRRQGEAEFAAAEQRRAALPDPAAGRTALQAAQARHDHARQAMQAATAALSAHDQALAGRRERAAAQRSEIKGWQARAGDAARRLAGMAPAVRGDRGGTRDRCREAACAAARDRGRRGDPRAA